MKAFAALARLASARARARRRLATTLYAQITARARAPCWYRKHGVADEVAGRFEMLAAHVALAAWALRDTAEGRALAQEIYDVHMDDLDAAVREMGVGDLGAPKRVKWFARMLGARMERYGAAWSAQDTPALAEALARNVYEAETDAEVDARAQGLAETLAGSAAALRRAGSAAILGGTLDWGGASPRGEQNFG